jgi:hypothetical protein
LSIYRNCLILKPDFKKEVGNHLKKDNSISYLPHIQAYEKKVKSDGQQFHQYQQNKLSPLILSR